MATETITLTDAPIIDATVKEVTEEGNSVKSAPKIKIDGSGNVNLAVLSQSEKEECKQLTKSINIADINSISNYGCELQNAMSRYSNNFLTSVRSSQAGDIGALVTSLLSELDYIDIDELKEPNGLTKFVRKIPVIRHLVSSVDKIMRKYDTISENVDGLAKKIEVSRMTSLRDNNALQVMFDNNIEYGKQMDKLIIAANYKMNEINRTLDEMLANRDKYEAYQISDVQDFKDTLDRKINDLISLRYVIKQSLPQIRTIQRNNIMVANKAQTIISTTLPLWRNQLSMAVALQNQSKNIQAISKISNATNELLKKNAELLHRNSVETARENQRSIIELETLKHTTEELVNMIKDVKQINEEGIAKRKEAEREIQRMTDELEVSLIHTENLLPSMSNTIQHQLN